MLPISAQEILIFGSGEAVTTVDLDVNAARLAHMRWEMALEALLAGQGTHEPLQGHEDCALGTWIYGTGLKRYGRHSSVWQLKTSHKKFHHVAEETMAAVASGKLDRAAKTFKTVRRLSGEVLYLLTALELDAIEAALATVREKNVPFRFLRLLLPKQQSLELTSIHSLSDLDGGHHALNVTGARLAHLKWIRDLQLAFRGRGRALHAQPSDECGLGVWIHGTAMKVLGVNEELTGLDAAHKRFHREVDVVLSSLHHGSLRRADEAYEDALVLSGEIVTHLTRLQLTFIDSRVLSAQSSTL